MTTMRDGYEETNMYRHAADSRRRLVTMLFGIAFTLFLCPAPSLAQPQGGALEFENGTNDFVRVASNPTLDSPVFTMEMWVRRESEALDQQAVVYRGANGIDMANGLVVTYGYLGADAWTVFINGCAMTGITPHPLGCWVHLAVTYDGNEVILYLNGEVDIQEVYPAFLAWDSDLYFGVELDCADGCFDSRQAHGGLLDDIRVWTIPRSQAQIIEGMAGFLDDPQFLAGRWTFDDVGIVANDSSGQSNHAFLGIPVDNDAVIDPTLIPDRVEVNIAGNVNSAFGETVDVLFVNGVTGDLGRTVSLDVNDPVSVTLIAPPNGPVEAAFALYAYFDGVTRPTEQPGELGWAAFPTPLNGNGDPQLVTLVNNLGSIELYGFPLYNRDVAPVRAIHHSRGARRQVTVALQAVIRDNGSSHPDRISLSNSIDLHIR